MTADEKQVREQAREFMIANWPKNINAGLFRTKQEADDAARQMTDAIVSMCADFALSHSAAQQQEIERLQRELGDALKPHPFSAQPEDQQKKTWHWLERNEKQPQEVKWSLYPIGMVQRWIERAESAEKLRDQKRTYCHLCHEYFVGDSLGAHGLGECVGVCSGCMAREPESGKDICETCYALAAAHEALRECRTFIDRIDPFTYTVHGDDSCLWCRRDRPSIDRPYTSEVRWSEEFHDADCEGLAMWKKLQARSVLAAHPTRNEKGQ